MKVSVFISDGVQQVNLTPENQFEKNVLNSIKQKENDVEFMYGSFSACQGGWIRRYNESETNNENLFMVIKEKKTVS